MTATLETKPTMQTDDATKWPSIAIVTPSFQAERYIRQCMVSVLDQNYPNLQYVVMDGGSSDSTVDIVNSFAHRLHYWTSGPDGGPYQAIAAGFAKTDAEILGWLNADDILLPWTLVVIGSLFRDCPNVEWVTTETPMQISTDGLPYNLWHLPGFTKRGFRSRENCGAGNGGPRSMGSTIQQESTFWRRNLWEKAGGRFEPQIKMAGDFELWDRFFDHALLYSINIPLGAFRW